MIDKRWDPAQAMLQRLTADGKTKEPIPIHLEQYRWLPDSLVELLGTYAGAVSLLDDLGTERVAGLLGAPPRTYEAKLNEESACFRAVTECRGALDEGRFSLLRVIEGKADPRLRIHWVGHSHAVAGWVAATTSFPLPALLAWWWSEAFCRTLFDAFGSKHHLRFGSKGLADTVWQVRRLLALEEVEPLVTEGLTLYLGSTSALFVIKRENTSEFSLKFGGDRKIVQRVTEHCSAMAKLYLFSTQ